MPATERPFSEPPPPQLYLDTDVTISYLVASQPHHRRCLELFTRLFEHGATALVVSSFSWLEFTHVVCQQRFRQALSDEMQRSYQLNRWQESSVRESYLRDLLSDFEAVLDQFGWVEVPVTPDVRLAAVRLVAQYNLGAQDALHLASATAAGVRDLASFDESFRRVDGLSLWNDRIFTTGL